MKGIPLKQLRSEQRRKRAAGRRRACLGRQESAEGYSSADKARKAAGGAVSGALPIERRITH